MKLTLLEKFLGLIILAIILAKFIHIEADPWAIKSTSDIHDEAWWAENAKLKIQEDKWIKDDIAGGLAVSPIINFIYYSSFKLFGISFFSLRIFSVLASILNIILYYLLSKSHLSSQKEALISTLLFASLPIYFILGRTGQLETGLILFLLTSILLVLQKSNLSVILAGIVVALGMQLKGSFLFLIPIIISMLFTKKGVSLIKNLLLFGTGAISISILFYIFYYYPNLSLFEPYYTGFRNEFYSLPELLHPAGIIIRLGYLYSKETITDPFIFLSLLLFIYRFVFYKPTEALNKLMIAMFIGFLSILFSDFNDKRIILLCVFFPILISKNITETKKLNTANLRNIAIFCSFSFFSLFPSFALFDWSPNNFAGFSIDSILTFVFLQIIVFVILYQFEKNNNRYKIPNFIYAAILLFTFSRTLSIVLSNHFNMHLEWMVMIISSMLALIGIYFLLIKIDGLIKYAISILIFIQIFFISIELYSDTYEIRKLNMLFSMVVKPNERIIGPNSIFEIAFLSKTHPIYFSKEGNISESIAKKNIIWYGAITNSEYSEITLRQDLKAAEKKLNVIFKPYFSSKIYKNKHNALIFKVLYK